MKRILVNITDGHDIGNQIDLGVLSITEALYERAVTEEYRSALGIPCVVMDRDVISIPYKEYTIPIMVSIDDDPSSLEMRNWVDNASDYKTAAYYRILKQLIDIFCCDYVWHTLSD